MCILKNTFQQFFLFTLFGQGMADDVLCWDKLIYYVVRQLLYNNLADRNHNQVKQNGKVESDIKGFTYFIQVDLGYQTGADFVGEIISGQDSDAR